MPRPPRFFILPDQISGSRVTLFGDDAHHIAAVLRMKSGEMLSLSDGAGSEYTVRITDARRDEVDAEIVDRAKWEIRPPRITLAQGIPKSDKMDLIVQKSTELGVAEIVPVITERTIVKFKDEGKKTARWQKIAREAAMQSNRPDIPQVKPCQTFKGLLGNVSNLPNNPLLLFPWEEGTEPVKNVLRRTPTLKNIVVLIGPEGGFSPVEAETAKNTGFRPVTLGPNILRTETAAIAVLSMIGYENL